MASERTAEDPVVERSSLPLDIDDVHVLLQVEQEQIQKRTFTNWVNAQLSKRRPPVVVLDLFNDFRDGARLLDLLEVMCSQRMSREKGKGVFQHRTNIEKALAFLRGKSIKLVNINVPDIMDGKPSIILGLIWTIIMHFHIEELAHTLSFSSRQSSLESLASLDTRSTSSSARNSPVPPHGSPLHTRFRISAKKALLLWVREQCHKAGCTLNVKDFKASWRSGVVFLAILCALRPDVVSLSKARSQSNRQNLEEAFYIAERELHIPRLLDPADVDVRDPDEKSIMTYVAQFLQYTKDTPASEEDMQVQYLTPTSRASPVNLPCNFTPAVAASPSRQTSSTQKVQEVTCWLEQAYQELLEGWESTEGESYAERYHVFQTFVVSFNEQRRPVMPLLTAMKRTTKLSEEQRALRHAWDSLAEKLREYKTELDLSLPSPLDAVGRWLLRAEETLADGDDNCQDHARAAREAREKHEMFKSCLEEMPRHTKTFQAFRNKDEYGETAVPTDKLEEIKRRFTTVRVSAKYHGIRLDYQDLRHTVLDLLAQLNIKLRTWKRGYVSQEAVRVLLKDWNETVNKQGLTSTLEETLRKLRHIANKYTSKSALAGDSNRVSNQMRDIETETAAILEEVRTVKGTISRTLTAWDSYCDSYTSLHAWLEQGSQTNRHGQQSEVTIDMMSEWSSCRERLNEVGNYLTGVTDPQTSRSVSDNLCRINLMWADFVRRTQIELVEEQSVTSQSLQGLIREATQLLKEPVEVLSGSLQTYRKRLQFMMKKIQDVDLDSFSPSLEFSTETLSKFKQAIPEVLRTLCEAVQVSEELQQTVSSLDGRLAELIHWEAEAREFYELLKDKSHRLQREQDSRTRTLISRGLQLEGQVVMEEQDLQEMVMSRQKNSPLQYLIASTMQDRVRSTVTQSQEAVGMLSSLGIRRDRSPTGRQFPRKVFVQEQTVTKPETEPQPVPMIVVQEYQEEKSQIRQVGKSQLSKESVKDLSLQSKPEAHAQQQVLTEVQPQGNLVDVVAFGETQRQIPSSTKETMESQSDQLETKQTQEQIQPAPLIAHEEPTQPQMQTQGQQQQMQKQEQGTSQQQALFQQSVKGRKSQKRADNRPWLHQKVQAEGKPQPNVIATAVSKASEPTADTVQAQAIGTCIQQQKPVTVTTSDASQAQVSATDANRFQAIKVTQTQAKMSQPQQQQSVLQAKVIQAQQQQPMTVVSSVASQVTEVQQQQSVMQVTQTKVGQVQQQQPVTQAKWGQVHQQPPASEMLVKEPKVPDTVPVKSQKQSQATTIQQHPQPFTATTFNHPPTNLSQMQLPGMTQTRPPIMSETYQYLPAMGKESQTLIHPPTPIQPQIIIQRQPNVVAAHSLPQQAIPPNQSQGATATPAKTKSTAPIQPRIITMPQNQPEFYKPSQSPPQTMGMGQIYGNVQIRPQPHIQQPQWRPVVPDIMTQSYNDAPHQGFIPSHMPPQMQIQSHTQSQGVTQTQQWGPLRGGLMTQTYPNVQGLDHVQPYAQSQGYPISHPQCQQWGRFQFEPTVQPYSQISHQSPVQSFVSSQHGQPVRQSNMVSQNYPRVQMSEVQIQVTQRPQSPPREWAMQPRPQSQFTFMNMLPQPVANTPWIQPPTQASVRPQGPAPQSQQQQWPQNRPEVSFRFQIQSQCLQSQPQLQVLQTPKSPKQQRPQQQSVPQVKSPALTYVRPQGPAPQQPPSHQQQWHQYKADSPFQIQTQSQPQLQVLQKPQSPEQEQPQQHAVALIIPPSQVEAPPQLCSDAYSRAEELAKNKLENAKRCLKEHVLEAFNVFKGKKITQEQKSLDLELLKEFLRAVQETEAFCTPSQLREMELFTQSVRTQWESCFSTKSGLVLTEQQLEALKQLCEILSPEDANKLAQAQLQEHDSTPPAIQCQSRGDDDTRPTDCGVLVEQTKEASIQNTALPEKPVEITTQTCPSTAQQPKTAEKKEILKQISTEEDRYRSSRFALQAQLNRNEQNMLGDRPSGSATATDLQKRLRELKALQDETETLWSEYDVQCSQCSQVNERAVEQDRAELTVKWGEQRVQLQRRVDSLGSALELMDSIEHHVAEISERLDTFIKEPKDVKGYMLINANILKDVKDLDESIQTQMDRLARFDSEPSHLDLRDRSPLTQLVLKHRSSLDRLRQQVRKSEAAARALDRFLVSLHTLDQDVLFMHSAPSADVTALQDSRTKLALVRKGATSLSDKAPQLDQLLGGAQMVVTQEGNSVTCLDMVAVLVQKVEDVDDKLIIRQEELQQEQQSKGLGMRKKTLLAEVRKIQGAAEKQGLKEPTMPAVQHRIRALSDLEMQMKSLRPEYESIRETASKLFPNTEQRDEMETAWEETERAVAERQEHCSTLMDLLKKFQSCRSFLGSILQRAEQTISEQASYMSKDSLQRLIARVCGIKEDLNGLGPKIEEFRAVCRQLQSQLKKLPDCSETPFEAEADALVDSWLDVSEKTDSYLDSLRMGLEVWEKQLILGEELEVWTTAKLSLFAESHSFSSEKEVFEMKDEIQKQERSIEQFLRKSMEIQELLQGKEPPLELQVLETSLRKKTEQVKELFDSRTDVFQELLSVREHLLQRADACQTAIQRIHSSVRMLCADSREMLQQHLQDLSDQLLDQEEEADSLTKEVELVSSVTAPQALQELSDKSKRLKDNIAVTREFISQKKEQREKSALVQSIKDECQMFEDWLQDTQLAVNECFENPETREDVEASMQRLHDFLISEEGDHRLAQVKTALEKRGQEEVPAKAHAELCAWQQEQEGELTTLQAHCQGRHKQLEDILIKLNSLQAEHDHLQDWLRQRETLPAPREKFRQVHEDFLKESGRIEAFGDLLASIRLKGLRGDPVLRDSESLVDQYHSLGIRLEKQSEIHKSLEKEIDTFYINEEITRTWVKNVKQSLESLDKDKKCPAEEKLLQTQAVLDLRVEGDSKMAVLKVDGESLRAREELEESTRRELIGTLRNIDEEWQNVLDSAQQIEAQAKLQQTLLKELQDLQDQEKDIRSWVDEQTRKLDFLNKETPKNERHIRLQEFLSLKHEGDAKLEALRKKGESVCAHEERKRPSIERRQRETEEAWTRVLQTAWEIKDQIEREDFLSEELKSFEDQLESTRAWIRELKATLQSKHQAAPAEEILNQAQKLLAHGPEGDSKLAALKHTGERVCTCEGLEDDTRLSVQQAQRALEEEWREVLDLAQILRNNTEIRVALDKELHDFNSQAEIFQTWVIDLQERFGSPDKSASLHETLVPSQVVENLIEADSKVAALSSKAANLCAKLDESRKESVQQTLQDVQDKLRMLTEIAKEHNNQLELQDSLSKELESFRSEEKTTQSWVEELKKDLVSLGKSTHGTQEQIEERLSKAQAILTLRPEGNCKMSSLKRQAESLCSREDLDKQTRLSLVQDLKSLEEEWKEVLQNAQELNSLLRSVVERLVSCQCQRQQTQSRVEQLKQQIAALPRRFPWPGLGDRRHALEQATALLDKVRSLRTTLSALRALGREMSQLTRDPSWTDPSWTAMEECVPGLIKDLMELSESLEEGICTERNCAQLVEQHSAAQDWLREQVKGFGSLPTDRHGLQGSINTLKALLQTVKREEREMRELDMAKEALINLCTTGGRDALTLETGHLHDLRAASEREINERLIVCETRLADIELKIAERAESFRAQAESILNDLRAQECLGFVEGNKKISQVEENSKILKTCEKELEKIECQVRALQQAVCTVPPDEALPPNVNSLVNTVTQQYCRQQTKLSERKDDCADSVMRCMRNALQALRSWTQSTQTQAFSDSVCTVQAMIEEGAELHENLQEAVSHKQLLRDCLGRELTDKLERDASNALKEADTLINQLQQRLQDLEEERRKSKALTMSAETRTSHSVSEVSCEWPRKPDTSIKVELNLSKPQDILPAPAGSSKGPAVETFEEVRRDVAVSTTEETPAKSERPLETLAGDDFLADNPSEAMLTMALGQKSGDGEVSMTVNKELLPESPTEEQPPLFAVDERAAEFGKDDPPTTTPATTSKQEQLTDVAASESLSHQADVLEFDTERIKPSKSLEEREFQLNTPVPTATDADLIEEISDDVDFPTPDRSLTALRIDRDKPKTVPFSTTALAVQSDKVQEPDVCAVDPGKSEGEIEMEMKIRMQELRDAETSLERKVEESSGHDGCRTYAQSLDQKSDAVEEANRNWSLTSDTFDLLPEEGKMPKKKIAALILDTDTVHIHSTEVPGMTDPNSGKMYLSSHTGCDGALSHRIGTSDTSDEARKRFDGHTSPDQQEREIVTDVIDSTNSSQPSEGNIDRTETQISNATNYEREGTRTTNNGPQEVQRGVEPLEHWTVNNGPQEIQRRYMILERNGGLEVRQEPAAETNVPALDTATSKTGGRGTGDSELEVMENIEQVVGKESAATEDSERVTWNAKKQSETLEIMGVPARRKLDGLPCSCEDKLVQDVDKVIVESESAKSTTVKGETEPTPPARRSKATESLSVSSDVRCEEAPLPVPTIHRYELEEIQLPPEGILHPPPDRTHKETVVAERLSLVLDSTTTPERRRKERAGYQQPEPEKSSETVVVEEPLIKPTPPLRQKVSQIESDGTSVVSMEETPVKPTPPTRRRDSGVVTDLVSDSGDLDKARTKEIAVEERVDKTTPAVRRKSIQDEREFITPLVSMPRGTEDLLVKPTPPTRRKDSRCVRDTVSKETASENPQSTELEKAVMQGIAGEEKPTPTVRRKGSLLSQIQKMEDTSVKPTPPERRRASRNFSDEAYEEMARKISTSTDLEKIPTQENTLEEPFIKPTPPVRRKVSSQIESDAFSVLSKIHEAAEMVVKPTPPTRRRDSRNISDIVTIKCSSSTDLVTQDKPLLKPTPPMRRKSQETEATLWKPTPPVRRRNSGNMTDTSASRLYGSCDLEDSVLVTPERGVGEALVKPTPPFRRKTLSRTGSDISIVEKSKEMEEASVKPTPPTRRRDSRNVSDKVAMDLQNSVTQEKNLKGFTMKPVPTTRQKTTPAESDPSVVSETQETEATLLKPTPPTRRRESTDMSDTVAGTISSSYDLENISEVRVIKPTPSLRKAIEDESDDIISVVLMPQEIDKTLGELTPPTRRRESNNLSDVAAGEISVSSDLETFGTQDRAAEEALVKPSPPEETLVKPILLTHGQDSRTMGEIVPNQAEGEFSSIHLDKTAAEEEIMVIQTPPGLQAQSDLSTIAKTQEMEGKLKKPITPTRRRDSISVDETVPKQMESNIFVNVLDETFRPESADEADLPIQTQLVVQDASQAESDVSVIDKTQKMVEILGKPISPTRKIESRTVDENVNVQMEREISSSIDLDNTVRPASAVEEDLVKLVEQEGIQAESDKSIIENKQEVEEKLEESTSLTSRGHSRNVDETRPKQVEGSSTDVYETVRQQSAEDKITPPLEQAASEGESNISSVVPKPHVPEETPMKPTEISQSGLEDGGTIEPALREENNKAEHENIKVSSISTQPEEPLPSQIAPIGQEKETVTVGLDIIPANVQEPSIQPVQKTGDIEKRVEVQPPIKQEDEQPEKEFCNASGMDRTKGLTEIESVVEAQIKVSDKSEIMDQESSVAKGIDVPEAFEQEQEDDKEEEPLGATTNKIFTEIEKMSKTRPNSLLIESRPYEDPMGILSTSEADLEAQMTRLVFCILSCRNSPAVLNPTDMAKQVEEAELCRQRAQQQVSSISKQAHINGEVSTLVTRSANDPEAMQRLSCRWTEALWDASGTVHTKEAQLQLVIDYDRQLQKARATLEKMVGELESLKMCPVESSFVEEQRLRSFLRTMEQERTVLGELIQTHSQLSPHLSQPERAAALSQQSVLQSEWMALERSAEKSLHKVSTYTKESFDLLEDINTLKEHLENCHKILESHWIPSSARDSKRVQETIGLGAELTAAKQRYFDIQENFEALSQSCNFKTEVYNIQQGLWSVKDHIDLIGEELEFSLPTSNNPSMVKIVKVITEAIAWAKKTQYDIENRERKVSLLPEEVHRQIKDLKMLNSDMTSKQIQLSTLTKEVTEMIPDLDRVDVPVVTSLLELLASLSKSTEERIAAAMEEIQLSLQTREKISEQITEVDSWIQSHLHKESLNREDFQSLSAADLDQRLRQSQDTLQEAEKHSGIAEALQMKSKDITSELSISENAWLYEKLSKLQEDIKGIINYEKSSILEIKDVLQNRELSEQKMSLLEQKLREMIIDMKGHTFPITKDSLDAIEPIKRILVEHKFQVEQINTSAEGRRRELLCVISELHHKMNTFRIKSQIHERFLSLKQRVEDLRENLELYVPKTKDESIGKEERYKICQSLLTQIPLIKLMYKEASDELLNISPDLYPSQLTTERERLKQNLETFNTWETAVQNNLRIVELDVLKDVNYLSEQRVVHSFLKEASQVLDKTCEVEFNQEAVDDELRKLLKLQKNVEARMRVLEVLEQKNGHQQGSRHSQSIAELAKSVLDQCDQRLTDLSKAKESLKNYFRGVRSASQFLQRTESVLLLSLCSPRSCSERLKDIQQALLSLDDEFQSRLTETQSFSPFSPLFSEQKVKQLQVEILGCLLVRMSTLKAQAQLRQEALERCVNSQRSTRVLYEELCRRVRDAETTLADCACKKITSQTDYLDQKETLKTLVKDVETLSGKLDELKEWCPVQGCRSNRDDAVNSLWGHVARLRRCTRDLLAHSAWRGEEWIRIKTSMEKASSVLERIEAAFPQSGREKATAEELSELLRFWSPYQDRLDCEHRALCALELRVVRLLRTERAEPVPLCQDLRTMQERYHSLKSRSAQGHKAAQAEMDERTKVREELRGIQEWLVSAGTLPSELERAPKAERLQELYSELCTQKAVLQHIMEGLRMKYTDMYTLVPMEIDGPLQEVSQSLEEVGKQVEAAVQNSGPLHRLDAKLSEINTGLDAVHSRLKKKCPNVAEAESVQKRVLDELDSLHSCLSAVEVELQDLREEEAKDTPALVEKLSRAQRLHTRLSKQAEDRTVFLKKIHSRMQEHEEMVKASQSWITESQSWLTAPFTYTTAKCLDSHVNALQMVLDDSAQIRRTLQGFESVLMEMASVCDVSELQQELGEADRCVADMQNSLLEPLKTLEHAAAEVDAMESELRIMEKDVIELKLALTSKQGISQDKFRAAVNRIELMKRTAEELKSCKTALRLPEGAENTLTVFRSVDLLLNKLLEIEQLALEHTVVVSGPCEVSSTLRVPPTIAEEEPQDSVLEQGQVEIVRMTEDVLKRSGAVLLTVKEMTLEQGFDSSAETQDTESGGETADADSAERDTGESDPEAGEGEHVASVTEAVSEPSAAVRTPSPPGELVTKTPSVRELSESPPGGQQKCVVS